MPETTVTIRNKNGIHCRPSSCIIAEAEKFKGVKFALTSDNGSSTLGSILELLALGLQQGDTIRLSAEGPEAETALKVLAELFAKEFDFPPKA